MKILVIGVCGYKGLVLILKFLWEGYLVDVLDIQWFGNFLFEYDSLNVIYYDVCDMVVINLFGVDVIIYLVFVVNDLCGDFDFKFIWEVSVLVIM